MNTDTSKAVHGMTECRVITKYRGITEFRGMSWVFYILSCMVVCLTPIQAQSAVEEAVRPLSKTITAPKGQTVNKAPSKKSTIVSLTVQDSTIAFVLNELASQAQVRLVYNQTNPALSKRIKTAVTRMEVMDAFQTVLKGSGLIAAVAPDGETIVIQQSARLKSDATTKTLGAIQDSASSMIVGRVIDSATNQGLEGVTVMVQGTNLTVITTRDGTFRIPGVRTGDWVIGVKAFGYKAATKTVTIAKGGGRASISFSLTAVATSLNEVVTSVTGTQRKIEIGNDVTTINADSIMQTAPITSVTDLLEGRVPGLTVTRSSGVPGAPSRLRLRGIGGGLLSNNTPGAPTNDPIVILDGIRIYAGQSGVEDQGMASGLPPPSPIDQIDPNSIDRIDVYKGPSAAAMYGSDAANGVIIITTKKGSSSSPAKWSGSVSQGLTYLPGTYASPNYYVFCSTSTTATTASSSVCKFPSTGMVDSVVEFQALNVPSLNMFGTGLTSEQSATVSGGYGLYSYSVTGTLGSQRGMIKMPDLYRREFKEIYDTAPSRSTVRPSRMSKQGVNASFTLTPNSIWNATFVTRFSNSDQWQAGSQRSVQAIASKYIDTSTIVFNNRVNWGAAKMNSIRRNIDFSGRFNLTLLRRFPITAIIGNSQDQLGQVSSTPTGLFQGSVIGTRGAGAYRMSHSNRTVQTANINGTLSTWKTATAVGINIAKNSDESFNAEADPETLRIGVAVPSQLSKGGQSRRTTATGGWFVEPRLQLNSKLFINPGFRFDGSTLSGSGGVKSKFGNLWELFPKMNLSWIAVDRSETGQALGFISMLRPRVSFGVAGVQPAPGWQLRLLSDVSRSSTDEYSENISENIVQLTSIGNTQLRSERTREIEGGFDLDAVDGRIRFSVSHYYKLRSDAIERIPVATSVYGGRLYQYVNIGEISNTGTELSLNATIIDAHHIRWGINMSVSQYRNKLIKLTNEDGAVDFDGIRFVPGYPINGRWERPILGYGTPSTQKLISKDVIVGDTAVYVGQAAPNFDLPFQTSITLLRGQLHLNAGFHYRDGMSQFNKGGSQQLANLYYNPASTYAEQAIALAAGECSKPSSPYCTNYGLVHTVSTLRFNSMAVAYAIPRSLTSKWRVPSLQISLQGSNLALWTNYRGKDPDVTSSTLGDINEDNGAIPTPRSFRLQLRFTN